MGNSVIYRPAYDAEVEYLESDGNSYIDTGLKASSELGILAHIQVLDSAQWLFGGANGYGNKAFSFVIYSASAASYRYGNGVIELSGFSLNTTYEFDNTQNHNVMKVGSLTYTATATTFTSDYNFYLFTENRNGTPNTASSGARIYDFKIYQNSTLVRDFIPVRIGSVGYMYDKVSKQLFANKGTGNFILGNDVSNAVIPQQRCVLYFGSQRSVVFERIYEEYEWLIKELTNTQDEATYGNKAVIDTLVDFTDNLIIEATLDNTERVDNRGFGVATSIGNAYVPFLSRSEEYFAVVMLNKRTIYIQAPVINISYSLSDITINGVTTSYAQETLTEHPSVAIGAAKSYSGAFYYKVSPTQINTSGTAKYGNFIFKKGNLIIMNLVPCRLLQPIPAILDGNGIARQAGECGMWDKVSNRFYGNVANSGTFTVKGPKCYEEYEWLKAICPVNTTMMTLSIGSQNFNWKVKLEQLGNISYIRSDGYSYYTTTNTKRIVYIWDIPNEVTIFSAQTARTEGMIVNISSTSDSLTFNGEIIPKYGFQNVEYRISNNINGVRDAITYISSITIDGVDRYIPVKLLQSIPATLDSNGIPRSAGECGMWDKVNDKFYGNVAKSGTFTVSND